MTTCEKEEKKKKENDDPLLLSVLIWKLMRYERRQQVKHNEDISVRAFEMRAAPPIWSYLIKHAQRVRKVVPISSSLLMKLKGISD